MNLDISSSVWRRLRRLDDSVVDGDTLRLADDTPEAWAGLLSRLRLGNDGSVALRLAAVDAPESHYPGGPPALMRQPLAAASLSISLLQAELARLEQDVLLVQVLGVDRYGRAIALVWPGSTGSHAPADPGTTLNARLLDAGACYPDFHPDLPPSWLAALGSRARAARAGGRGLWPLDASARGFALDDLDGLRDRLLILPRLFRRVADFWRERGEGDVGRQPAAGAAPGEVPAVSLAAQFREFLERRERPVRRLDPPTSGTGVASPEVPEVLAAPGLAARSEGSAAAGVRASGCASGARTAASLPFAEWLALDGRHCRLEGCVENFLYETGCAAEKTDVAR